MRLVTNGSLTVIVEGKGIKPSELFYIHYVGSKTLLRVDKNHIYYGIGNRKQWSRFYRDLNTDLQKHLML